MERRGSLPAGLIMQHGELTRDGKEEIKKVAQRIKIIKFRFDEIATSPLQRAQETATIVASVPGKKVKLTVWDELAPWRGSRYGML